MLIRYTALVISQHIHSWVSMLMFCPRFQIKSEHWCVAPNFRSRVSMLMMLCLIFQIESEYWWCFAQISDREWILMMLCIKFQIKSECWWCFAPNFRSRVTPVEPWMKSGNLDCSLTQSTLTLRSLVICWRQSFSSLVLRYVWYFCVQNCVVCCYYANLSAHEKSPVVFC